MKLLFVAVVSMGLISAESLAMAEGVVYFEEDFNGAALDPSAWRTEILTSGVRWCDTDPGQWASGIWVAEGSPCYGVPAYAPYGSVTLSGGMVHLSSTNGQACPYIVSRFPEGVPLFPEAGDFTLTVRMRYDRYTPWGTGLTVFRTGSTEPVGTNPPSLRENVVLQLWCHSNEVQVVSAREGAYGVVALVTSPLVMHEFVLECAGSTFTVRADGEIVYGPVSGSLRPSAIWIGNPVLAYWYPTDWTSFSVDEIRVDVPGPTASARTSWGALKVLPRSSARGGEDPFHALSGEELRR